ncbi:hypothetical protein TVAG_340370 [Trichomonas vaginalis G3]|uniref:Uncharacterized protein n=1 Tax=Trichomonas vaginalis (strain ATCC PRA-98 / G3) TaxID=412133 RepID=A2EKF1_TRIV3|nr:hypothetical protein TVAGG3_0979830 [Trichomonas vaginalis G3]EAY06859.1 hypothetical protein TVAG_340370 [Trichomonas vaginalis G3]KAI5489201.1 hypothetical protein TVAGG3_0979830 [Trichomonas vaginalis G3]|eukprot:XP_001319082.1 hypothetical protein [Trichomonas vaginalis G3]
MNLKTTPVQSEGDSIITSSALQTAYERIKVLENENFMLKERNEQIELEIQSKCDRMQKLQEQADQARTQYNELLNQIVELNLKNRSNKEKFISYQTDMNKKLFEAQTQLSELRMQLQAKDNEFQLANSQNLKEHQDYTILSSIMNNSLKILDPTGKTTNPSQLIELITKIMTPKPTRDVDSQTDIVKVSESKPIIQEVKPIKPESPISSDFSVERHQHRSHRRRSERSDTSSHVSSRSSRSDRRFQFDHIDSDVAIDVPLDRFIQIHNRLRNEEQDYSFKSHSRQ